MTSPIQLENHHLLEVLLRTNPTWEGGEDVGPFNAILQVRGETLQTIGEETHPYTRLSIGTYFVEGEQEGDALSARTILTLDVNGEPEDHERTPYTLRLVVYGEFTAYAFPNEGEEREHALRVLRANTAGLLYGIARHQAAELTLQSPYRSLALPSLSFQKVIEREIEREEEAAESE